MFDSMKYTPEEYDTVLKLYIQLRNTIPPSAKKSSSEDSVPQKEETKETIEHSPEPSVDLNKFLYKNLKYPKDAMEKGIQGRVILNFVVDIDGSISDIKVSKSVFPSLDKEAIRVVSKLPKFKPGLSNGKPVRVRYSIPVNFRMM